MASGFFEVGFQAMNGLYDLDGSTLKIMLLKSTYSYDPDTTSVTTLAASECDATNYTGGFGGSGRKTATITSQQNTGSNRWDWAIADLTWTALGGGTNNTLAGCALVFPNTNDAGSTPIAFFAFTSFTTNGSDVTLDFASLASGGNLQLGA
jgi:hypothetical protein